MTCPQCRSAQLAYAGLLVITRCPSSECGFSMTSGHYLSVAGFLKALPGLDEGMLEYLLDELKLRRAQR